MGSELWRRAADTLAIEPCELQLCRGSRFLARTELRKTLEQLDITEGVMLTTLRRSLMQLIDPGVSRFNTVYFCTVSRVQEVGLDSVQIDFETVGDMSLGEIQDATRSTLSFDRMGRRLRRWPMSCHFDHNDLRSCVRGTLTYDGVPESGQLSFRYGDYGYS